MTIPNIIHYRYRYRLVVTGRQGYALQDVT